MFINYRRGDTKHAAGRMHDAIVARYGQGSVFVDVESIEPGLNFVGAIDRAVSTCDVMLVLIGETWLDAVDEHGRRRLDDPSDTLRLEIEAGLRHQTRVIPVLVDAASMPRATELPPSLAELAHHQWARLRHDSFQADGQLLLDVIQRAARGDTGQRPVRKRSHGSTSPREDRRRTHARWLSLGALVAALLVLVSLLPSGRDSVQSSALRLPADGPWAALIWLLPAPVILVALWLVGRRERPGIALGCLTGAALIMVLSLLRIASTQVGGVWFHVLLLALLLVAVAGLVVAAPALRARVRRNRWDRMLPAGVLVVTAAVLRTESFQIVQAVSGWGDSQVRWGGPFSNPGGWAALFVTILVGVPAVLVVCHRVQVQALLTLVLLQLGYVMVFRAITVHGRIQNLENLRTPWPPREAVLEHVVQDLVFLLGGVCLLLAVLVGQSRSGRVAAVEMSHHPATP